MPRLITLAMNRLPPGARGDVGRGLARSSTAVVGRYIQGVVLDGLVVGGAGRTGTLGGARAVPPPARRFRRHRERGCIRLGPLFSAAAPTLVVLQRREWGLGGVVRVAVLFLFIKVLDDTLIQPLTIGRSVHLHPALLLGSVVVGNHTLGVLGMIIAVPVATVLQETVRLLLEHRRVLARRSLRSGAGRLVG